jgi:nitrite reductase/ring-hydroxylating ferredoxin subunit
VAQTAFQPRIAEWTPVLDDDSLPEGSPRRVTVSGTDILLYRSGNGICALSNRCGHRGGPLHKGRFTATDVRCPWHHSIFRLEDGSVLQGPATAPQPSYDVRVNEGRVDIRSRLVTTT